MSQWEPTTAFAKVVYAAGFEYDPSQDIIYSRMHALQRNFGYAYAYDDYALDAGMIIDCEPIFFDYDGKVWMIELWKGQYGIETGCEVGVYVRDPKNNNFPLPILDKVLGARKYDPNPEHNLFFNCANDKQMLEIGFVLYRDGKKFFQCGPETHWWLTGFRWGMYSDPKDLSMEITIRLKDSAMENAFVTSLRGMGYTDIHVDGSSHRVSFTFAQPMSYQPRLQSPLLPAVQTLLQGYVAAYDALNLPNNDPNHLPANSIASVEDVFLGHSSFYDNLLANAIGDYDQWREVIAHLKGFKLMDFSCNVEMQNKSTIYTLVLDTTHAAHGTYDQLPPQQIPAGQVGRFILQDNFGIHGAEGWVTYALRTTNGSSTPIQFKYECPTGAYSNDVEILPPSSNMRFYAKVGDKNWQPVDHVPENGHPLYVQFVIYDH
ncbi:MAG: DUF4474 domain-containing protein [Thermoanaerobaculia bacterium]